MADRKRQTSGRRLADGSPMSRLPNKSTTKSGKQSENVYENKGRGKKVVRSSALSGIDPPLTRFATLSTLPPKVRDVDEFVLSIQKSWERTHRSP